MTDKPVAQLAINTIRTLFPALADEIERMQRRELPDGWDNELPALKSLQQKFGFTPEHVVEAAKRQVRGK